MASFTIRLVERLRLKFAALSIYAESFPAPKDTGVQIVAVISSGDTPSTQNQRTLNYQSKRIVVTGTAKTAIEKATEIWRYLVPEGEDPETGFQASEYAILNVQTEQRPVLLVNTGKSFIAEFRLRFFVAE